MIRQLLGPGVLAFLLLGCAPSSPASGPPGPSSPHAPHAESGHARPACEAVATTCHGHDAHGGVMRECHLLGHNPQSTNEVCEARKSECLAACKAPAQ